MRLASTILLGVFCFLALGCGTMRSLTFWKDDNSSLAATAEAETNLDQEVVSVVEGIPVIAGTISWVDTNSPQAVIILRQANQSGIGFLLSRSEDGQITGLLESQDLQQGRSLAMTIVKGQPQPGDWVTPLEMDVKTVIRKYFR